MKYVLIFALFYSASTVALPPFKTQEWLTKTGVHTVFYQAMEVPMLELSIAFAAGSAYDGDRFGLSALTLSLLNQGNSGNNGDIVAEKLADTGAQYSQTSSLEMVTLHLKTLVDPVVLKSATELFAEIIAHPDFPAQAFEAEKNQQLMEITTSQETPDDVADQTFYQVLYKDHPYAHPMLGNRNTVLALTVENVRDFYHRYYVGNNATLVLVGAISPKTAKLISERLTIDLPKGEAASSIPESKGLMESLDIEVQFPSKQTILRFGQLGITHQDPDYFPLIVGNYILGGGTLVSRLGLELREKRGLTYGVYSQFIPLTGKGPFVIGLSTRNTQAKTAIEVTRNTFAEFIKSGPTDAELSAAKQYIVGSFPLTLISNRSIADVLLKIAFYHMPKNYLQTYVSNVSAVTKESIIKAFQHHIDPSHLLQISVGQDIPRADKSGKPTP